MKVIIVSKIAKKTLHMNCKGNSLTLAFVPVICLSLGWIIVRMR